MASRYDFQTRMKGSFEDKPASEKNVLSDDPQDLRPPSRLSRSNQIAKQDGDHLHGFFYLSVHLTSGPLSFLSCHFTHPCIFPLPGGLFSYLLHLSVCLPFPPFRCRGGGRVGAGQGADSTNSRKADGKVQSQGGGDATAVLCGWRGEISYSRPS